MAKSGYGGVDYFKLIAAILVIAIHTGPLLTYSTHANFILTGIVARIAVPFFFIASGYFFFKKLTGDRQKDGKELLRFSSHIGGLYAIAMILYLPLNIYAGYFAGPFSFSALLKDLLFNGMFYHLWYLPALVLGTWIVYWLHARLSMRFMLTVTVILYAWALLGDSYYGLTEQSGFLTTGYDFMFSLFDYTRNGIGFAPLYIALGAVCCRMPEKKASRRGYAGGLLVSMGLLLAEGMLLRHMDSPRHDSMYIALAPAVYCLFRLMLLQPWSASPFIRHLSTWIYILHPIAIVLVRGGAKQTGLEALFIDDSLIHFTAVMLLSILLAAVPVVWSRARGRVKPARHRAWAEIHLEQLEHNLNEVRRLVPQQTRIMAVIKANAYGHGSVPVARRLNQAGVRSFAVAEIEEGIKLRKKGIKGEILILGYTPENRLKELRRYKLTQTVIDAEYGEKLQAFGKKLKVHIKINTGMSRLGESAGNKERLLSMYRHKNLQVMGTFSHLAAADHQREEDITFTRLQYERFDDAIHLVEAGGLYPGTPHLQSSYGILNASGSYYGIVRPGIILYGLLSNESDQVEANVQLRPVLSLKATVMLVRSVRAGDTVGYGGYYTAVKDSKIATISIGYADGLPRELSDQGGFVLIHGQRAKIVGKICMDQMMVDVTAISGVRQGDIATVIGQDGNERITAGEIAKRVGTITNEVVSALGSRVERVYI